MKKILLIMTVFAFFCVGCSKKESPEQTMNDYFSALKKGDYKTADLLSEELNHQRLVQDIIFYDAFFRNMRLIKITKVEENGEHAIVEAKISMPDIEDMFNDMSDVNIKENLLNKKFEVQEKNVRFNLDKKENKWVILRGKTI